MSVDFSIIISIIQQMTYWRPEVSGARIPLTGKSPKHWARVITGLRAT